MNLSYDVVIGTFVDQYDAGFEYYLLWLFDSHKKFVSPAWAFPSQKAETKFYGNVIGD